MHVHSVADRSELTWFAIEKKDAIEKETEKTRSASGHTEARQRLLAHNTKHVSVYVLVMNQNSGTFIVLHCPRRKISIYVIM